MGKFRLLLAISVVLIHSWGFALVGGEVAVRSFFIISGFLITRSLITSHDNSDMFSYFNNRLWRLLPMYFLALISHTSFVMLNLFLGNRPLITQLFTQLDWETKLFVVTSHFFIIGQDLTHFVNIPEPILFGINQEEMSVSNLLLIPQAWSLSLEIYFYLLAPFFVKNRTRLILVLVLSLLSRTVYFQIVGENYSSFNTKFFPFELMYFCLGALAYHFLINREHSKRLYSPTLLITLTLSTFSFPWISLPETAKETLYYLLLTITLPTLLRKGTGKFDKFCGDISYSVYMLHMLTLYLLQSIASKWEALLDSTSLFAIFELSTTLLLAVIFSLVIEPQLKKYRRVRKSS